MRVRKIRRVMKLLEIVDAAPVTVHIDHLNCHPISNQFVQQRGEVQCIEVLAQTKLAQRGLEQRQAMPADLQHANPAPLRRLALAGRIAGNSRQQDLRAEQTAIVAAREQCAKSRTVRLFAAAGDESMITAKSAADSTRSRSFHSCETSDLRRK